MTINITTDTAKKLAKVFKAPERAAEMQVRSDAEAAKADEALAAIAGLIKEVDSTFDPIIKKNRAAWQEALDQKKRHRAPLEQAKQTIKDKLGAWLDAKEEARVKAEAERKRKIEEARKAEEAKLEEALAAEEAGDDEAVDRMLDEMEDEEELPVVPEKTKLAHSHAVRTPRFEIVDASKLTREYLTPDTTKIGKVVKALGLDARAVLGPGVRVWIETSVATRTK